MVYKRSREMALKVADLIKSIRDLVEGLVQRIGHRLHPSLKRGSKH